MDTAVMWIAGIAVFGFFVVLLANAFGNQIDKAAEVAAKKVTSDERADPYWRGAFSMLFLIAIAVIVVVVWWNSSG
jgi:H+/Cl- antiporter ClcA